ncbi:MAG TPA: thiamine pyrophosphate-dependent enzyme [Balneolales bacterium]|nr:thiamine pyrophosphate-dependent enzyme [Balneolales bacterium]
MITTKKKLSQKEAVSIHRKLLLPRRIEEKMLKLLRQNRISKWFSGIGQEAIAVGATLAVSDRDYILPMHRNLGVFTTREVPLYNLFCQLLGKEDGYSNGRERSFHFGTLEHRIIGMISHLAAMMPVADGLALASKMKDEGFVALSFSGDGASSEGDFHEAINLASVWELPVIFLVENNGYGLSTPIKEQFACDDLADRAPGYGIEGMKIDGNNIFEVIDGLTYAREKVFNEGKPILVEAKTFRMRGHEEASGTAYVPDELFEEWGKKDPIKRLEHWLIENKYLNESELEKIYDEVDESFQPDLQKALEAPFPEPDEDRESKAIWGPIPKNILSRTTQNGKSSTKRYIDAITKGLEQAFDEDGSYLIMGQDIAGYGGVFKVTKGFLDKYGNERVRNTPIIESGALGAAYGLALEGFKPVVEMQFSDFITCGYNQIVNNLAKSHYRWSPPVNVTIRCPNGGGVGAGPFHSTCPESWFMQHPGLKIAVPGTVEDAHILTYSALLDPNPVIVFEHKKLYRSLKAETPDHVSFEPLGKAKIRREGSDATIITYGMGLQWALEIAEQYAHEKDINLEVLDLRTLVPVDFETISESLSKTNKALLLQEPGLTMGPMSEISSLITEHCFEYLDAPVMRCASLDTPVPTSAPLEKHYLANARLDQTLQKLLAY